MECFFVVAFWCCQMSETSNVNLWQQRAVHMGQNLSTKIPFPPMWRLFVVQLFSPNYKRRIKTPHKTWNDCSGFQNNRTNLKSCDLLMWRGWDVALGWGVLRWVFTKRHWCQMILYLTSPGDYWSSDGHHFVWWVEITWRYYWHPWFALLVALQV